MPARRPGAPRMLGVSLALALAVGAVGRLPAGGELDVVDDLERGALGGPNLGRASQHLVRTGFAKETW